MSVEDFSHISYSKSQTTLRFEPQAKKAALNPAAAPTEQHIKNLECNGTYYRVVKEDPIRQKYVSFSHIFIIIIFRMKLLTSDLCSFIIDAPSVPI